MKNKLVTKISNYFKNKIPHKTIKYEELYYLNELLKTNLPLKTSLTLIKDKRNQKTLNELTERLDKGELVDEIIVYYLPKEISKYVQALMKNFSFQSALELSIYFYEKSKDNQSKLLKDIIYPVILLFVSLSAMYLFDMYGLDSILSLLSSFKIETISLRAFRIIIRILINLIYVLFLLLLVFILYFSSNKRIVMFYILLSKYLSNSLIKIYFTEEFISLFVICTDLGYKTKESIKILRALKNKPVVSFLAFHMEEKLLKGENMIEAVNLNYYDPLLNSFMRVAAYSKDFTSILSNYSELSRMKIKNRIKLYTSIVQFSSYVGIGVVIVFIYQVLFLPMQAISNF